MQTCPKCRTPVGWAALWRSAFPCPSCNVELRETPRTVWIMIVVLLGTGFSLAWLLPEANRILITLTALVVAAGARLLFGQFRVALRS